MAAATTAPLPVPTPAARRWRLAGHVLAVVAIALLFLAPAIWNGYPLVYFDSEDYVNISFDWQPIIYRVMTYGAFVAIARPFDTLWAVVAAQALMLSWVLREAVFAFVARWRLAVYLGASVSLALFTGLGIVTSEIMADVFAGIAILGLAILAFGDALPSWRRGVILVLTLIAIAVHMSHVAVACGLALVLLAMRGLAFWLRRMPRPRLVLPLLATFLGTAAVPATHWLATGDAYISKAGNVLQLGLLIQNGLAKKYLDAVCDQGATYKLCAHKDELPYTADEFLWGNPDLENIDDLGGWVAMHDEADAIVAGTVRMFPLEVLKEMAINTWTQITLVADGEDLVPMTWHFVKTELKRYPAEFRRFHYALQQRRFGIDFDPINRIHVPIAEAGELVALGFLAVGWRRRDRLTTGLILVVLFALLGNAIVCGAISNPHDRYQNRIVWLALFSSMIAAVRLDQRMTTRRPRPPFPDPLGRLTPLQHHDTPDTAADTSHRDR